MLLVRLDAASRFLFVFHPLRQYPISYIYTNLALLFFRFSESSKKWCRFKIKKKRVSIETNGMIYHSDCKIFQTILRHIDTYGWTYIYHVDKASDMSNAAAVQFHNDYHPDQVDNGKYYCQYICHRSYTGSHILLQRKTIRA